MKTRRKDFVSNRRRRFALWAQEQLGLLILVALFIVVAHIVVKAWYYTLWPLAYDAIFHRLEAMDKGNIGSAIVGLLFIVDSLLLLFLIARHTIRIERRIAKLEQLIGRSPHLEPPCYVSSSGLVRLPSNVIQELGLHKGGGVSFVSNKETGRYELWTTEQVEEWLGCKD